MKKIILFASVFLTVYSCAPARMAVVTFIPESNNQPACRNPQYLITMSKQNSDELELSLYSLLKDAQNRHGNDVTIQNVRWDVNNGLKVSAIFDVIRCNPDTTR